MPLSKTFETLFKLNAKWLGAPATLKAQQALHKTAAAAQGVNVRVKGMAKSIFTGTTAANLFSRAVGSAINVLERSVSAAADAQEAHDNLSLSMERNTQFYSGLAGKTVPEVNRIIAENVDMLIKLSEQMEKTGHDAETLQAGWEKLLGDKALSPQQVKEQSKAFSDVLSKMFGANATQQESVELGEMWSDLIMQGNQALAKRLGLDQGHLLQLRKINLMVKKGQISAEEGIKRRQRFMVEAAKKFEGATEQAFDKPSGKFAHMQTMFTNLLENMGKPFIAKASTMATSFEKIAVALGPTSEKLAQIVDVQLAALAEWLAEHKMEIPKWLEDTVGWLNTIDAVCASINKVLQAISDLTFGNIEKLFKLGKEAGDTLAQKWTPGTVVNPAVPPAMDWRYGGSTAPGGTKAQPTAAEQWGGWGKFYSAQAKAAGAAPTNQAIATERARVMAQLQEPGMRALTAATIGHEQGTTEGRADVLESLVNRAVVTGKHPRSLIRSGFYGPVNRGEVDKTLRQGVSMAALEEYDRIAAQVAGGRNRISGRVDQGMLGEVKPGGRLNVGGEYYGFMGLRGERETAAFRNAVIGKPGASLRGATRGLGQPGGGGGPQNISMSSPITVNGVAPGREAIAARKVQTAIRDPIRQLLDQIVAARNYQDRIGYV